MKKGGAGGDVALMGGIRNKVVPLLFFLKLSTTA